MLGEGFDLPELKIAAFHDIRKSLAVTLQLAGRFTREKPHLGDATFVANIADVEVRDELRRLYRHDSDWNALLPLLGDDSNWGFFKKLAEAVAGSDVEQIRGPVVFRCLAGVNRLKLQNVGLLEQLAASSSTRCGREVTLNRG